MTTLDAHIPSIWAEEPTVTDVARTLQVSRTRVRERLQGLGLLSQRPQIERRKAPGRRTNDD